MSTFSGSPEDRLLIRERFGAYSDSVFQSDVEAWLANWTESGVWILFNKEISGKSELRAQWEKLWQSLSKMMFFTEIGSIKVVGDRATARSYCREILYFRDGRMQKVVGMYEDELVREDGVWIFALRNYQLIGHEARKS